MLADLECSFVEVGHSERRRDHGETDEVVALKVRQVIRHDMTPIICVGELEPTSNASALDHVLRQARAGLKLVPEADRHRVVIAYEPVWAIGEGAVPADPEQIGAVHRGLHELGARVIYGGSVDPFTAGPILAQDGVDGLFGLSSSVVRRISFSNFRLLCFRLIVILVSFHRCSLVLIE